MDELVKKPTIRIKTERKELLSGYADAAACLYGALSIPEFVDVFNHYEEDKTDQQEATLGLQRHMKAHRMEVEYEIYDDIIVGPTLFPNEDEEDVEGLRVLRHEQKGKSRYLPTKAEFLKYRHASYKEPLKPYDDLKAYILKNKLQDKEYVGDDLDILHELIQDSVPPAGLIHFFSDQDYPLDDIDQANAFLQLVMDAHNHTRMFENNGFTPNELFKMSAKNRPQAPVVHQPKKVGRNDPCSCGSGKKFKKCCHLIDTSGAAQLSHHERKLFYETWYKLLDDVNCKLKVVDYKFSLSYLDNHDELLLHKIREQLWGNPSLISEFIAEADYLTEEEISLLLSWEQHHIKGKFALLKYTPDAAILMCIEGDDANKLYAVKGMTSSIANSMKRKLPVMLVTVLLPFKDKIIYDSFMGSYPLEFNDGVMDMFESEYEKAEKRHGIITKL